MGAKKSADLKYIAVHQLYMGPNNAPIDPGKTLSAADVKKIKPDGITDLLEKGAIKPVDVIIVETQSETPKPKSYTDDEIIAKIKDLDADNEDHWTQDGKPNATVLDISAERRNKIWEKLNPKDTGN